MPLVTSAKMLRDAQSGGYAVGAFNIENMEMAQAVVSAAEQGRAPVIVQTTPGSIRYAGLALFAAMVSSIAAKADVPVALHLDHGDTYGLAKQAAACGYTSVMIDASRLTLAENIGLTSRVVAAAGGVPVEAELGTVGGKEDGAAAGAGGYTSPAEAAEFERSTGIAALAVGIGTAHGFYSGVPVLDVERLSAIRALVQTPLVLHGASGLSEVQVRDCIGRGICKVNYATELRAAYTGAIKEYLAENQGAYDPKQYGAAARDAVKRLVLQRMAVCGCLNRV